MRTVALILMEAGVLSPGFHLHIENPPWMPLDIEDIETRGPNGLRSISVAHYGQQNGDVMRDPEMLFEVEQRGQELTLTPYAFRNDYFGIEQYASLRDEEHKLLELPEIRRQQEAFARLWDANLRAQGFLEMFLKSRAA